MTRAIRGPAVEAVYAGGTVEASNRVEVKARLAGPIAELLAHEGDRVERDQVLARIEVPTMNIELQRGRLEVEAARERTFPALASLRAQEHALEEQVAQARYERSRAQRLVDAGSLSPQEFERIRLQVPVLEEQLEVVRAQRNELRITRRADVMRGESELAATRARAQDTEVRSPLAGQVLSVHVEVGELVQPNANVMRVGDANELQVEAQVDEADVGRVRVGMPAAMRLNAFGDQVFRAHVTTISPEADRQRNSFKVVIVLDEPVEGLRPGMSAEVNIIVARHDNVVLVPLDALNEGVVWVVDAGGRVRRRTVQTGLRDLRTVEIVSGVAEGDRVVTNVGPWLHDGLRVDAVASAAVAGSDAGASATDAGIPAAGAGSDAMLANHGADAWEADADAGADMDAGVDDAAGDGHHHHHHHHHHHDEQQP